MFISFLVFETVCKYTQLYNKVVKVVHKPPHAVGWFVNYLSERSQCVHFDGLSSEWLNIANAAYHSALRCVTNCKALTHHCTLYAKAGLP